MRFFQFYFLLGLMVVQSSMMADVTSHFNTINKDPNALYSFLKAMPKGGELHYHLEGGIYPETLLALASQGHYCLNEKTFSVDKAPCPGMSVQSVAQKPALYEQIIQAWSMKNFIPGKESGHDHFFNSFSKIMPLMVDYSPQLLADILQRAADQKEQYLEIMMVLDRSAASFAPKAPLGHLATAQKQLLANPAFQDNIQLTVNKVDHLLDKTRQLLHCSQKPQQAACQIKVKFQYVVLREQPLEQVFAQALNGFAAASRSSSLVGINLVQAEDGFLSLRDYSQQMAIFAFLRKAYPQVHLALHAGELAPSAVSPPHLSNHINEAVYLAQAERIGHGVSVAYENRAEALLRDMAKKQIPVEINLTSNQKILNIVGKEHPLRYYLKHRVPVVLSTDDEGILRTELTREYMKAVLNHHIDYPTLKQINRNALTYSFLPGQSLWANAAEAIPVKACQHLNQESCLKWIKNSEKAQLQWQLEQKLNDFESTF